MMWFTTRYEKRRAQIFSFIEQHRKNEQNLRQCAKMAVQQGDYAHEKQLLDRAEQEVKEQIYYKRLALEHNAGLTVYLPGDGEP